MYKFNEKAFEESLNSAIIDCKCNECNGTVKRKKLYIKRDIRLGIENVPCTTCTEANLTSKYTKTCKQCNKIFRHNVNVFCTQSCAATYNNLFKVKVIKIAKTKIIPNCLNCSIPLKSYLGKYCDNKCHAEYRWKKIKMLIEADTNNDLNLGLEQRSCIYKKYIIEKRSAKCEECGWSKINPHSGKVPIELEHIDGNCTNNKLCNLKLLCPSCHSLTSTYKGLNKGNGSARYKLWKHRFS